MSYTPNITEERIKAIVKRELKIVEVPMNVGLGDLGASHTNLISIQNKICTTFGRTVRSLRFIDTIYTIHEQLTTKPNTHERALH